MGSGSDIGVMTSVSYDHQGDSVNRVVRGGVCLDAPSPIGSPSCHPPCDIDPELAADRPSGDFRSPIHGARSDPRDRETGRRSIPHGQMHASPCRLVGRTIFRGGVFLPASGVGYRGGVTPSAAFPATEHPAQQAACTRQSMDALRYLPDVMDCGGSELHGTRRPPGSAGAVIPVWA